MRKTGVAIAKEITVILHNMRVNGAEFKWGTEKPTYRYQISVSVLVNRPSERDKWVNDRAAIVADAIVSLG